ncbi:MULTISPECIES: GntR family transcriptional regulator [unclassified Streptomyces]|uniref:GntR family transcriptional regulator n=1 Tax=unclassified Streptomyces TaxID=2593676 RepID=UPI002ED651D3|nr:GntR family transcriptional regulator [Streptomyces sp. NBC_00891]WSY04109.1 GntR family transcriptional regulator [Streptomyces sp. NBC_00890]WSZ05735.1 GntR family transcriptional regulator [Streptomyces sp. NBC_00869]WSZ26769.1 GntR family transcriptional regulator [Streptomyces sp. NBC_00870]
MDSTLDSRLDSTLYTPPDTERHTSSAPALPLRDMVYGRLRAAVLDGEFGPRERLAEMRLAARFGVSRTPVREALARLLADGLIERGDGGFFVTIPNLTQLRDLYELRVTLELRGIARAIDDPSVRHEPGVLKAELERWYAMRERPPDPDPRFVVQDERFHAELSRASGNPALTDALVAVSERIRRVRMYDFLTRDRVETTITEHIEIMEAVRDGRLDDAHRALHAHVGDSMAVVLERAQRAMTQMALHADRL